MRDARGLEVSEKPDGPLSSLFWEHDRRLIAATSHATIEGHDVGARTVLESYDRAEHPWIHGRRPLQLVDRVREWWSDPERGGADE